MVRKAMLLLAVAAFVGMATAAMAQEEETHATVMAAEDVGNTVCPVMDGVIEELGKDTVEYEGKVYNLCCADCKETFLNDPDKYAALAEAQVAAVAASAKAEEIATMEIEAEEADLE